MIYLLFFLSGFSALVYQLVWVRAFGNVFGNTIYSASIVVAVFMAGLGAGSLLIGGWSDRRYAKDPSSLLRIYAYVELAIALAALGLSMLLPHLAELMAGFSAYVRDGSGWYVLSWTSYASRVAVAVILLTPITLLMGGTLTLLIRHLVRANVGDSGWRIAMLYAVNTIGAALGALMTDFTLVPAYGLRAAQSIAVSLNVVAAIGALYLAARPVRLKPGSTKSRKPAKTRSVRLQADPADLVQPDPALTFTSLGLFLSGFGAMGMEILWFRHFSILLGGFRAVFAILLTVILLGIGLGSLCGGVLHRRVRRPAQALMAVQALFIVAALAGLAQANGAAIDAAQDRAGVVSVLGEIVYNGVPIVIEILAAALLMGFTYPLANAIIQRAEASVGWRAGVLYLANTGGAVCGSLCAGFLLLPSIGLQHTATVLAIVSGAALLPWYVAARRGQETPRHVFTIPVAATAVAGVAVWTMLPGDFLISRALPALAGGERLVTMSEGLNEVISVTETESGSRALFTNGHSMSSTQPMAQRYMRALAHVPLLSMDQPRTVLVIGFGVGNTTHAATLHPSVERVDVVDLSMDVLDHADHFSNVHQGVLQHPKVVVHVNDGRHHLRMQPMGSYDLITLEPPPPAYAGMAALYSREFYALARTRLTSGGYVSQWLPAYQLPAESSLAMVRAFIDAFPQAVLLSGAESELLLLGRKDAPATIDAAHVSATLAEANPVADDLRRVDLAGVREIVGSFLGSPMTLASATRDVSPVTDDHPIQEYGVRSLLGSGESVPSTFVDLGRVLEWCPTCFVDEAPAAGAEGLDMYLALMDLAYRATPEEVDAARRLGSAGRRVAGSAYLGRLVPESAAMHNVVGISLARAGDIDGALAEFRAALQIDPDSAATHWHLGAALASTGARSDAIVHLRRSIEIDPRNEYAQDDLRAVMGHVAAQSEKSELQSK